MRRPVVVTKAQAAATTLEIQHRVDPQIERAFTRMNKELTDMAPDALYRDAMRWRALMACDQIKATGHCSPPHGGLPSHAHGLMLELWSHTGTQNNYLGRAGLIELADYMRQCLGTK